MNKICGVYKITSPTGKVYIGSSRNINRRFILYKSLGNKAQPKLYNSFIKYGVENHVFEIIKECVIDELYNFERYFQETYNSVKNGLNCVYVGTDTKPIKISSETRKKMSESAKNRSLDVKEKINNSRKSYSIESKIKMSNAQKGKTISKETKIKMSKTHKNRDHSYKNKKVSQFNLNGEFIREFDSIKEAINIVGNFNISTCCRGKRKTAGGYIWKYSIN